MGERDYLREGFEGAPRRRFSLAIALVVALVAVYAVQLLWRYVIFRSSALNLALEDLFALHPSDVLRRFRAWQLLTSGFLSNEPWQLLFDCLPIFFFGRMIEDQFGIRRLATVYFGGTILAGIAFVVIAAIAGFPGTVYYGATGAVMAILVVGALEWPDAPVMFFVLRMPLKYLTLLFIAAYVALGVKTLGVGAAAPLAGAGFAFAYWKLKDRVVRTLARWDEQHERRERRKSEEVRIVDERRIDAILEKIARDGIASLTGEERRLLDEASRKKRQP